jgi:hypothetical protein
VIGSLCCEPGPNSRHKMWLTHLPWYLKVYHKFDIHAEQEKLVNEGKRNVDETICRLIQEKVRDNVMKREMSSLCFSRYMRFRYKDMRDYI